MYYFVGIKGSGMASLAEILHDLGHEVAGSDIDKYIFIEEELKRRGIPIYSWNKDNIKDGMHVITGNDFDESNEEVYAARHNPTVKCQNYCEFLGEFFNDFISIGIAGTHGKTTTTGMCYHLFKEYDKTNVLIGDGTGHAIKDAKYFVSEVDEFRNHFKHYYNDYAMINNVEYDHVDYFKTFDHYKKVFEEYGNRAKKMVVIWGDDPYLPHMNFTKPVMKFGLNDNNDLQAKNVINNDKGLSFDVYIHNELFGHFNLPFYGMHTLYDTLAVITLGYLEGMDAEFIQENLSTFEGVKRRYSVKEKDDCIFVDDYAHHPTAVEFVLQETRTRYPGKEIVAVFQPDRFSRALRFSKRFAKAMDLADYPYFLDFPENAHKEEGIDIDVTEITQYIPRSKIIKTNDEDAQMLAQYKNCVYVFMSSKDIYKLEELVIKAKG